MTEIQVIRSVSEVMPTACHVLIKITNLPWWQVLRGVWSFSSLDATKEWDENGKRLISFEFRLGKGKQQDCYLVTIHAMLVEGQWQPAEAGVIRLLLDDYKPLANFRIEPLTGEIIECVWQTPID